MMGGEVIDHEPIPIPEGARPGVDGRSVRGLWRKAPPARFRGRGHLGDHGRDPAVGSRRRRAIPAGEVSLADTADLKTGARVAPLAFRRTITRADYGNAYTFSDLDGFGRPRRVVALRCKYLKGMLQLVKQYAPDDPTPADSSDRLADKTMNADWMRNIELRRANGASPWIVQSVSEVLLLVDDKRICLDCHAEIEEVRLQSGAVDVTLQGNALALDSLIRVGQGRTTMVTARSRNDAHVVLLTDALGTRVMRRIAPNVYSASMATGAPGLRHFTVEAISDSSLFDDAAPVSQHGWTILYSVDP
jgi:hypothetical protein